MAAQVEKSEPKWNRDGGKKEGGGVKQRQFSKMQLTAQESRGADRPLISLLLCLGLCPSLLNQHALSQTALSFGQKLRICDIKIGDEEM